jgi:hypothetical protein
MKAEQVSKGNSAKAIQVSEMQLQSSKATSRRHMCGRLKAPEGKYAKRASHRTKFQNMRWA